MIWGHLTDHRVLSILKNPADAGVYVFGRFRCVKQILQDGQIRQQVQRMPRDSWLESRWNESLHEQREQILALARDLPRLCPAETTSAKDRKRLLRLLLQDITVERDPGRQVILHVRWFGGACEDLHVTLPAKIRDRLRYPPDRIEAIRRLAAEHTDAEIADIFNQRGQLSSRGQRRIPAVVLRRPDELTVDQAAAKFGVRKNVVYYWIEREVLPARQLAAKQHYWGISS